MAVHLTRGELKRDELGEAVGASMHWIEIHLKAILLGVGAVLLAVVVTWGVFAWRASRDGRANVLLGQALEVAQAQVVESGAKPDDPGQPTFATAAARDAKAKAMFEKLTRQYGATGAGAAAQLWLGQQAFSSGDRASARTHWEACLHAERDGSYAIVAQRDLWLLDRLEGKGQAALTEIRGALERDSSTVPTDVLLWELAETERALGNTADAQAAYRRIVDEHSDSAFASAARAELAAEGAAL